MSDLARGLVERRAEVVAISDSDDLLSSAACAIHAPKGVDEVFTPVVYIALGQLFAYYLAVAKGHNPDQPRGLSKVTLTR